MSFVDVGATHAANEIAVARGQVDMATDFDRNRNAMIEAEMIKRDAAKIIWTSFASHGNRSGTNFLGRDARNNTTHTQSRTISLNRNSPVRFHAIGSVETLHFTTPGVEK